MAWGRGCAASLLERPECAGCCRSSGAGRSLVEGDPQPAISIGVVFTSKCTNTGMSNTPCRRLATGSPPSLGQAAQQTGQIREDGPRAGADMTSNMVWKGADGEGGQPTILELRQVHQERPAAGIGVGLEARVDHLPAEGIGGNDDEAYRPDPRRRAGDVARQPVDCFDRPARRRGVGAHRPRLEAVRAEAARYPGVWRPAWWRVRHLVSGRVCWLARLWECARLIQVCSYFVWSRNEWPLVWDLQEVLGFLARLPPAAEAVSSAAGVYTTHHVIGNALQACGWPCRQGRRIFAMTDTPRRCRDVNRPPRPALTSVSARLTFLWVWAMLHWSLWRNAKSGKGAKRTPRSTKISSPTLLIQTW